MIGALPKGGKRGAQYAQKKRVNYLMFVQTYFGTCAIIILVTPPLQYIVFATPHKNEIPSPKKASYPAGLFTALKQMVFLPFCRKQRLFAGPHL